VDPDAADRFPELAAHEWPRQQSDPAKWRVDVGRLYGVRAVESCEPSVLLFPEVGHVDTSRFALVSPADAIARLVRQSAYFLYRHDLTAGRHFAALGHLVRQSAVRRLILGRDVLNEPGRFAELLLSLPQLRLATCTMRIRPVDSYPSPEDVNGVGAGGHVARAPLHLVPGPSTASISTPSVCMSNTSTRARTRLKGRTGSARDR
jgi:hypothetical protein